MKDRTYLHAVFAVVVIFVTAFTLFYIFDTLEKLGAICKTVRLDVCKELSFLSVPVFFLLIVIAGLGLAIVAVAYIMFLAK